VGAGRCFVIVGEHPVGAGDTFDGTATYVVVDEGGAPELAQKTWYGVRRHGAPDTEEWDDGPNARTGAGGHPTASVAGMSKISLIAKLTAVEGKEAELEAALHAVVEAATEEDGLEVYSAHRVADQAGVYYFFEVYRDEDAFGIHGKGDRMRTAMGGFAGLLAGRPEVTMMSPVAAKGIDI
jgi:quinol monooxygenase YgiN